MYSTEDLVSKLNSHKMKHYADIKNCVTLYYRYRNIFVVYSSLKSWLLYHFNVDLFEKLYQWLYTYQCIVKS
jgi:hypothetical protein